MLKKGELEKIISSSKEIPDAISYANQTGRLDLVSIAIAMFSVVLGVGAVYGFMHIKEVSEIIASNTAEKWLNSEDGRRFLDDKIRSQVNTILGDSHSNFSQEEDISTTISDSYEK